MAGVSRSSSVVIAYLIREKGMTYDEAFGIVKVKRSIIDPNRGFVKQL
jgi:protein-tyrosine phosphatase